MVPPTGPDLLPILEELRALEPIFHTRTFGLSQEDRERRMSHDYWEVGASGHRYSRDFILNLDPTHFVEAETSNWRTSSHAVQRLGPHTYLFTYTLKQQDRLTRRATVWQSTAAGWQILYHQGTLAPSAAH